jgi:Zn-finger nucleic acid-binding protein
VFCPECGTKLPFVEAIGGIHPIYECPKCEETWVYDSNCGNYASFHSRQGALDWYGAEEKDIVPELTLTVPKTP